METICACLILIYYEKYNNANFPSSATFIDSFTLSQNLSLCLRLVLENVYSDHQVSFLYTGQKLGKNVPRNDFPECWVSSRAFFFRRPGLQGCVNEWSSGNIEFQPYDFLRISRWWVQPLAKTPCVAFPAQMGGVVRVLHVRLHRKSCSPYTRLSTQTHRLWLEEGRIVSVSGTSDLSGSFRHLHSESSPPIVGSSEVFSSHVSQDVPNWEKQKPWR